MKVNSNPYVAIDVDLLNSLIDEKTYKAFEKSIGLRFYDETVDYYIYTIKDKNKFIYASLKYNIPIMPYEYPKY